MYDRKCFEKEMYKYIASINFGYAYKWTVLCLDPTSFLLFFKV